jgi:undecaprenyl-diphosphatase
MFDADRAFFLWVNAQPGAAAWLIELARAVSGTLPAVTAALAITGAVVWPKWRRPVLAALLALVLAWLAVRAIRVLVPLPRPGALGLGVQWQPQGLRPAFPSMHATTAFAFAAALAASGLRPVAAAAWLVAMTVAWSRVFLGLHFPSDIVGGLVLGSLLGALAGWWVTRSTHRWTPRAGRTPPLSPHEAAAQPPDMHGTA